MQNEATSTVENGEKFTVILKNALASKKHGLNDHAIFLINELLPTKFVKI